MAGFCLELRRERKNSENRVQGLLWGKIWDLHVHSNQCGSYKGRQKDVSISEYIDDLARLFQEFPNLEMISFTDHNQIGKAPLAPFQE